MRRSILLTKLFSKYKRISSFLFFRRIVKIDLHSPIISFTFDDAPKTSIIYGGDILRVHNIGATFYLSLGLLESDSPSGPIASLNDLHQAINSGHEFGCHTYDHKHSWNTATDLFLKSVLKNLEAFSNYFPTANIDTFSYPICGPRPLTKKVIGNLFQCCRSGGQFFNFGSIDLNLLKAFFLDLRIGNTIDSIKILIDQNVTSNGWLIFATHDIDVNPSRYGCSIDIFEEIVSYASQSGALLLPVSKACKTILSNQI